jgi:type IV secretory pathway VirB10-like protein
MVRLLIAAALVFVGVANVVTAQSLGDVAKKEEQRRKTVKSTGKVYTNDQLKADPTPSVPATSATGTPTPAASSPAPAPAPSDDSADKGDEKTWRKKIADARDAQQRSQTFADALQSQLNALTTDFVNRDDPAQRQQIANKRDSVLAELERVKKEAAAQTKAISDIQEEARRAGVPAGWVR